MRQAARTASSTRPGLGVSPCPRRGRNGKIFDYCSREMAPQKSGTSRNRETTYSAQMAPLARYVKSYQVSMIITHLTAVSCPLAKSGWRRGVGHHKAPARCPGNPWGIAPRNAPTRRAATPHEMSLYHRDLVLPPIAATIPPTPVNPDTAAECPSAIQIGHPWRSRIRGIQKASKSLRSTTRYGAISLE
jgi:hypothetical protein